ncbi:cysteine peptidase family C39 domain-containing protein [Paenibacillus sp. CC-CFT747]|nr:cysteine peptidase family C39 domain-containing protein [Paenibacillus sp. CC-CFT747]
MFNQKVCIRQQERKDCAPACLASIARYYGSRLPVTVLREACGTDPTGTNALGLVQAAESIGFEAQAVKGTADSLLEPFPFRPSPMS